MTAYTPTFLIGSNKNANVLIKDVSVVLCSIRFNECEDSSITVLERKGSKGYVYVNGRVIKKGYKLYFEIRR
ncbi:putative SMAD/FHA domain superfamily protein [Helianthus anomalus]